MPTQHPLREGSALWQLHVLPPVHAMCRPSYAQPLWEGIHVRHQCLPIPARHVRPPQVPQPMPRNRANRARHVPSALRCCASPAATGRPLGRRQAVAARCRWGVVIAQDGHATCHPCSAYRSTDVALMSAANAGAPGGGSKCHRRPHKASTAQAFEAPLPLFPAYREGSVPCVGSVRCRDRTGQARLARTRAGYATPRAWTHAQAANGSSRSRQGEHARASWATRTSCD